MIIDVIVSWENRELATSIELATLIVDHPDHGHLPEEVTVGGEWKLFVVANPGDGPHTLLQSVTIRLAPRCVRRQE